MFCAPTFLAISSIYLFACPTLAVISLTTSSKLIGEMSFAATKLPCSANARARRLPLPLPAPVIKTTFSFNVSIGLLLNNRFADWHLIAIVVSVQRQSQIRGRVEGIIDIQFIFEMSVTIVFHNGKMQMDADRVGWVAGIIALTSKECAGRDKFFRGARREF